MSLRLWLVTKYCKKHSITKLHYFSMYAQDTMVLAEQGILKYLEYCDMFGECVYVSTYVS